MLGIQLRNMKDEYLDSIDFYSENSLFFRYLQNQVIATILRKKHQQDNPKKKIMPNQKVLKSNSGHIYAARIARILRLGTKM